MLTKNRELRSQRWSMKPLSVDSDNYIPTVDESENANSTGNAIEEPILDALDDGEDSPESPRVSAASQSGDPVVLINDTDDGAYILPDIKPELTPEVDEENFRKEHCRKSRFQRGLARWRCRTCYFRYPMHCGNGTAIPSKADITGHEETQSCRDMKVMEKCKECEEMGIHFSDNKGWIWEHKRYHKPPFRCRKCSLVTSDLTQMQEHLKSHLPRPDYLPCRKCRKRFASMGALKAHYASRHEEEYQPRAGFTLCLFCFAETKQGPPMITHFKRHLNFQRFGRKEKTSFRCNTCDYEGASAERLKNHLRLHELPYQCRNCDHKAESEEAFRDHWRTNHPSEQKYVCDLCSKTFRFKESLRSHIEGHDRSKDQDDKEISKRFKFKYRIFHCFVCDEEVFGFKLGTHLRTHIRFENKLQCRLCPAEFDTKISLVDHMGANHGTESRFQCHACSFITHCVDSLNGHIKIKHEERHISRPFACSHPGCQKSFNHQEIYEKHVALHTKKTMRAMKRNPRKWTRDEDEYLCAGVREFGKGCWKEILEKFKENFHESRDRFSIRLRYVYLEKMGQVLTGVLLSARDGMSVTEFPSAVAGKEIEAVG